MGKRLKVKVELEFECPASVPPAEAFVKYFDSGRAVENIKATLIESSTFTIKAKENSKMRSHNEARRVLRVILDLAGGAFVINRGYNSTYGAERASTFEVQHVGPNPRRTWFTIRGAQFQHNYHSINLSDPNSTELAAQAVKCTFGICNHPGQPCVKEAGQ